MDKVEEGVFRVIARTFRCDPATLTHRTQAEDVDGWDSLSHTVLLVSLEDEFGIRLNYEDVLDVENVGGLIECVRNAARSRPASAPGAAAV